MTVTLIDEDGNKVGQISLQEAQGIAKSRGKDLIEVNKDSRIFKIGDLGKIKYNQKQKRKVQLAQRRAHKIKEIQMRPTIDNGDLDIKLRRMREFLGSGLKTRLIMKFKRQQMAYKESGMQKVNSIVNQIVEDGLATPDKPPVFDGQRIVVFLVPNKPEKK